ncbi:DUF5988 family protein [Streptomyces sp. URMC 127]|uniref:DUF5988 family protein n=1 Tax=Streptomyces sp. URMC 127 TaxID=3423402 RepID=UPI003F1DFD92
MADNHATDMDGLAVLLGGPSGLPSPYRLPPGFASGSARLTVAYYGRHHHFERTDEMRLVQGRPVPVFRFSYSTAIAE